jgi:hypothetical protein
MDEIKNSPNQIAEGGDLTVQTEQDSKLTSECPPPPCYYKLFSTASQDINGLIILPPRLSEVDVTVVGEDEAKVLEAGCAPNGTTVDAIQRLALEKQLYGGSIFALKRNRVYSSQTDYKSLLKENLKTVLTVALDLTSNVPPPQSSEVAILTLNNTLTEIHNILGEYRMHEGREKLILLRTQEIQGLHKLADEMEALLVQTKIE